MPLPTAPLKRVFKFKRSATLLVVALLATFVAIAFRDGSGPASAVAPKPKPHHTSTTTRPSTEAGVPDAAVATASAAVDRAQQLAATDPHRAIQLALAESDDTRRLALLREILRNWAGTDPEAAADWAWAHQDAIEQGHAFSAIFNGTQQNPDAALRLARRLSAEHPQEAWSFGRYLVYSFAQAGHFAQAADFAATTHPDHRIDLLTAAYHPWGCQQPEKALQSAIALEDPLRQNAAFEAVIGGWAQTNPQSLTEAAYKFPEGHDRSLALVTGLRSWIEKDPAAAEIWIKNHKLTAEESARALEE